MSKPKYMHTPEWKNLEKIKASIVDKKFKKLQDDMAGVQKKLTKELIDEWGVVLDGIAKSGKNMTVAEIKKEQSDFLAKRIKEIHHSAARIPMRGEKDA